MTNIPASASNTEQKPATPPANPQQQNQGTPKPAEQKPNEQQK